MPDLVSIARLVLCGLLLLLVPFGVDAQTRDELLLEFVEGSHTYVSPWGESITRPFRLFIPREYDPALEYPIILALHGRGAWGNDNWKQILWGIATVAWADTVSQSRHPAFIVAPQAPPSYSEPYFAGNNAAQHSISLLDSLISEYAIDTDRIYVTGLSMGGYGTWNTILERPDFFAAAVPMSGAAWNTSLAPSIAGLPIWAFHGELDNPEGTRRWFEEFERLGLSPSYTDCEPDGSCKKSTDCTRRFKSHQRRHIYTELERQGHIIWEPMYADPVLFEWLFSQERGQSGIARVGSAVAIDVDAGSVVSSRPGRKIGLIGDRYPLDPTTPLELCPEIADEIFGGIVEFPDTTVGELNYRFVHYDASGTDHVHESLSQAGGNRSLTLVGSAQSVPVLYWNDEGEQIPSPVEVLEPENGSTSGTEVLFEWQGGDVGGRYDIQVDTSATFNAPILERLGQRESSFQLGGLDTLRTYFWRIRASNVAGPGEWTSGQLFTLGLQPQLLVPADGAVEQPSGVTLRWRPYLKALSYVVTIADNEAFEGAEAIVVRHATEYEATGLRPGTRYYWRVQWRALGAVPSQTWSFETAAGTDLDASPATARFALFPNYPNPYRGSTTISFFSIDRPRPVTISVLDVVGREVTGVRVVAESAGEQHIQLDASGLPSGIYFYRVSSAGWTATRSMIILN